MTWIAVRCPHCQSEQIVKRGKTARGTQRYLCQNTRCAKGSFLLDYCNRGCLPEVKHTIIDMSLNASGVRDTARVLHICPNTVLRELKKKEAVLESVNTAVLRTLNPTEVAWDVERAGETEMDEMWSFVRNKSSPRWLWHAIDHHTGKVLAYVFGRRTEICQSYYDSRNSLYLVVVCSNHKCIGKCIGFVKARTVVSTSARRPSRRYRMSKPDNSPPRLCPSAPPKLRALRRRCSLSSGRRSLWRRVGV